MAFKNDNFVNTAELGRAIKRRREELGLSLRDVADPIADRKRDREAGCGQHRTPYRLAGHADRQGYE